MKMFNMKIQLSSSDGVFFFCLTLLILHTKVSLRVTGSIMQPLETHEKSLL